ncbi:phosphate-starvation-inducible PsiE family protein [Synechococcus sp. CCY 9618]|uniref:phosphate-starvation-inducible PsiE family protein n=1 Tax=Synechococcus sp. CCY 9618 TaxID=2815602 RepID=UPI001C236CED|nr:phosphate-starvation-inducible PsiE family protein [Synechococcus sp. CCY 9618]
MPRLRRIFGNAPYLRLIDHGERLVARVLGAVLLLVLVVATGELVQDVFSVLVDPSRRWVGDRLTGLLGDLLNLLIAIEVLQNITSYLRRHVVQIELVLLTAITAVARKVIVLPPNAENKPMLVVGLGVAVVCLAGAFWLVRQINQRESAARTGPARSFPDADPLPAADADGPR